MQPTAQAVGRYAEGRISPVRGDRTNSIDRMPPETLAPRGDSAIFTSARADFEQNEYSSR